MQVSCSNCGAQYEFDASAIPAEGYDAQCTTCNAVFFVAPEEPPTAIQVAVSCNQCGAIYQFVASDIPAAGYDAQCTQCQNIFFVSPETVTTTGTVPVPRQEPMELAAEAHSSPVDDVPTMQNDDFKSISEVMRAPTAITSELELTSTPLPVFPVVADEAPLEIAEADPDDEDTPALTSPPASGFAPRALDSGTMEINIAPRASADELASHAAEPEQNSDLADVMTINAELGEPLGKPAEFDSEDDAPLLDGSTPRRWLWVAGSVAALLLCLGISYFAAPRFFELTLGRVIGVKHSVDPAAVETFKHGQRAFFDDTDAGYVEAEKQFGQALKIDPLYADALAWSVLSHLWRGIDMQAEAEAQYNALAKDLAEMRGLRQVVARERVAWATQRLDTLVEHERSATAAASNALENAGKAISDGLVLLQRGRRLHPTSPVMAEVAAIAYLGEPDGLGRADRLLADSFVLRYGSDQPVNRADPPDAFVPYAQGKVHAAERGALDKAQAAYDTALAKEPQFQRARWELAQVLVRDHQIDEAKKVLKEILADSPKHRKARAALAVIAQPTEKIATQIMSEKAAPQKRPAKAKRTRGKRR